MAGLTLTLEEGHSAIVSIPLEDENGNPITEKVRVTCVQAQPGRVSIAIEAPRDFPIDRVKADRSAAK